MPSKISRIIEVQIGGRPVLRQAPRISSPMTMRTTKQVGGSASARRICFTAADYSVEPVSHATTLLRPACNGTRPSMPSTLFARVGTPRECRISPGRDGCV